MGVAQVIVLNLKLTRCVDHLPRRSAMAAALPSAISASAQNLHAAGVTVNGKAWLLERSGRLSIWQYEAGAAAHCHQRYLLKACKPDEPVSVCLCQAQVVSPFGMRLP